MQVSHESGQRASWLIYSPPFRAASQRTTDLASMNRFAQFIQNHPFLTSLVVLLAVAAVVIELRHRTRGAVALGPIDAVRLINAGALVVDVRGAEAYAAGHIIDSRHIQENELASQADSLKKYREKPVLLYCDSGGASAGAARLMKSLGFSQVVNLRGGLAAWKQENLPVVTETKSSAKSSQKQKNAKHA
jgi:rhodanese-related sulfurtransferase